MDTQFKASFLKAIKRINDDLLKRDVILAIENVEQASNIKEISNLKKRKGYKDLYRIRIGVYRIGIKIENKNVFFVELRHRKDIYKHFP